MTSVFDVHYERNGYLHTTLSRSNELLLFEASLLLENSHRESDKIRLHL